MAADTGPIGGDLSHEFIILAETGESQIYTDKRIFEIDLSKYEFTNNSLSEMRKDFSNFYAVTDEKFDEKKFNDNSRKIIIKLEPKVSRSDTYFILEINTQNL